MFFTKNKKRNLYLWSLYLQNTKSSVEILLSCIEQQLSYIYPFGHFIYLYIYLSSGYKPTYLSIQHLSSYEYTYNISKYLCIYKSSYLLIYLSICHFECFSICMSSYLSIYLYIYLSYYQIVRIKLFIYLYFLLSIQIYLSEQKVIKKCHCHEWRLCDKRYFIFHLLSIIFR